MSVQKSRLNHYFAKIRLHLNHQKYKEKIKQQKNEQTFSNLASLLQSFEIGKKEGKDLIYFVEDDYLHFEPMMEEMIASYERIASQIEGHCICALGDAAAMPVRSFLKNFWKEFEYFVDNKQSMVT